jgi:hypothetical protein
MMGNNYLEGNDAIIRLVDQCSNIDYLPSAEFSSEKMDAKTSIAATLHELTSCYQQLQAC